jgi:hypothetical protein
MLEDFKRGTLFQYNLNKTQQNSKVYPIITQEDNSCWINDISLGRDDWNAELNG